MYMGMGGGTGEDIFTIHGASIRIISPAGLERNLGKFGAMFFLSMWNRGNRMYTTGEIDYNDSGELCLRADGDHELITIEHGDVLKLRINGKKGNRLRDYVFLDDSD